MKLNYKRTILVGFAFFLISAFWQAYDATIPVILTNKFGMNQIWSGVIMALDNVLAVFMLPIFGALSDKSRSKYGKRTPFITIGTIIAAIALIGLSFVDNSQLKNLSNVSTIDDPKAMSTIYDTQASKELETVEHVKFKLSTRFPDKAEFVSIKCKIQIANVADPIKELYKADSTLDLNEGDAVTLSQLYTSDQFDAVLKKIGSEETVKQLRALYDNDITVSVLSKTDGGLPGQKYAYKSYVLKTELTDESIAALCSALDVKNDKLFKEITHPYFINYVAPARQACAADATAKDPSILILFVVLLLAVLIAMALFRSPAVALMPDVTIKPLRSKGNAIINLMGTAGGILVLVLGMIIKTSDAMNAMMSYIGYYCIIVGIMLTALSIFLLCVRETKWAGQMREDSLRLGIDENKDAAPTGEARKLSGSEKRSLVLILASIALWYIGYNAVTSKYALYAGRVLDMDYNATMLVAQGAAIISYLPAGIVASKIGRKKTILTGVVLLSSAFAIASFMRSDSSVLIMNVLFAMAGIGWATINVNSFPMVVEMCSGADIGKYTGYYYTASMAAQIVTPILSGFLMDEFGMTTLFPYAAVFAALAFLTMFFVKHGDAKPEAKKGLEALDNDD